MEKIRLLLVEDDADLGRLLSKYLDIQGIEVSLAPDNTAALLVLQENLFDIAVLDVMLPECDGFSLAQNIRKKYPQMPFLFLTARKQKEDVLKGLSLGADDYIMKPFDADELILRIQNILRRSQSSIPQKDAILEIGSFTFEPSQLRLNLENNSILLTKKETGILELLAQKPGRIVSREDVLEKLWGQADYFNGRSLDVYIGRLRKLFESDSLIKIESVRGAGFILHTKL
ncbi:DNA-binding response OmpR family regulator [Chryseobacterium defluvii]|uniref:DNA-binding response OmpR family regulator n=1 Tax=Chryseobacterium defluvii TaxID=160396 RepID=A0A840KGZ1_9FLAO|nr:response regulator transcription factor [Chryseobacterium defluvii]MBB4807217.1 DNA-binding response OmpR family regulator [Chryseobacterium defluvii]